jgi:uncharacterized protein
MLMHRIVVNLCRPAPALVNAALRAWRERSSWRVLAALSVVLASAALSGCAWLDSKVRELAYRPTPGGQPATFEGLRAGDQAYQLALPASPHGSASSEPQRLQIWWLPQADPDAPALLYLHGTYRNLYRNIGKIDALRDAGYAVLAVDYRGWGNSSPIIPSEATINADAALAWTELVRHQPKPSRRVIYGHSMGGGAAIELASHLRHGSDYGALIVESTFTNLPDVAATAGWLGRLLARLTTQRFDSLSKIGKVDAPILIVHGSADKTVPVALGQRLRDGAPPGATWVEIPGGSHSRLQDDAPELYRRTLRAFGDRLR